MCVDSFDRHDLDRVSVEQDRGLALVGEGGRGERRLDNSNGASPWNDVLLNRGEVYHAVRPRVGPLQTSHLVSCLVEMKLTLSQEKESQRTVHGGNVRQGLLPACRRGPRGGSDSEAGASGAPHR